ncbi:MAG: DUF1549 and DUF1553 domain-containing protein [Pirellulaceae bacterium]
MTPIAPNNRPAPDRPSAWSLLAALLLILSVSGVSRAQQLRDVIDAEVSAAWKKHDVEHAPPADDAAFLRRVYLDLCGTIPSYEETKAFLDDDAKDKREKLVDRLLDDPRYALHQGDVWDMVLFGRDPPGFDARDRDGFQNWIREQFAQNTPYDEIVRQLLQAKGNTMEHGAPMYLVQYKSKPEDAAVAISQTFLGVQLQCARCHDHPYEAWTQLDFYGMAAFLARLEVVTVGKKGKESMLAVGEKNLGDVLFTGPAAEQEPGQKGEPVKAKFLLGEVLEEPQLPEDFEEPRRFASNKMPPEPKFSRKDALADWIASPDNPYLARAIVNRVWAQFMGRGLVHPVDNMSESNTPTHPELLEKLAAAMVDHQFDLKWYIRELVNSQTYQIGATGPIDEAKPYWFARARTRPLSAEELAISWRTATYYDEAMAAAGKQPKEGERFFGLTSGYMMNFFGQPENGVGDFMGGLHEHLYLNNGQVASLISSGEKSLHHTLTNSDAPWEERIDRLFLSVLSRYPSKDERQRLVEYVAVDDSRETDTRLREAIWALMTCSEFRFNH